MVMSATTPPIVDESERIDPGHGRGLLVILGAGASVDSSCGGGGEPPPLTKDLVSAGAFQPEVMGDNPHAVPVIDALVRRLDQRDPATSLEIALRDYQALGTSNEHVKHHLMAFRFYLRELLLKCSDSILRGYGQRTNYTALANGCYQWAVDNRSMVGFVSFNYDPLFETACATAFGFNPLHAPDYVRGPNAFVLKPHGSADWTYRHPDAEEYHKGRRNPKEYCVELGEPETTEGLILDFLGPALEVSPLGSTSGSVVPLFPAIALPVDNKNTFIWPSEQRDLLEHRLARGSFGRVLIVGWRGVEAHFLELLIQHITPQARIVVVSGGANARAEADDVFANLGSLVGPSAGRIPQPVGFDAFMRSDWRQTVFGS